MKKILKNLAAAAMLGLVFCTGVTSHASNGNVVLVLDPGHDVHDAGARRTWNGVTYAEETITLKMAQYCKEELEKYSGIVVYMTRFSNNVDMDRYDRVKVAKDLGADALVSLHINSTGNQQDTVSGALAYVPISSNKADYAVEARALAADIVSNLSTVGMKNLGYLKGEGLGIIYYGRQWKIPTMIIEHGFVNNPSDCLKYYGSDAKIKAVAVADATAIARHYGITKMRGWNQIGDEWIYLDKNGNKKTGWITDAGKEYYLDEEGHKVSGFVKINDKKYYFNEDGSAYSGFLQANGTWYYFGHDNIMQTGWVKVGSRTCYFKKSTGVRRSGWFKYRGKYYYLNPKTGAKMKKRWVVYNGNYYYLDRKGVRLTGTKAVIDGKKYRFDANGICKKKTRAEAARQKAEQVTPETGNVTSTTEQVTPETKTLSE